MVPATRELVRGRADGRCEYCLIPQQYAETRHHVEHIRARQHGGDDDPSNLALACVHCNLHKGPNLAGVDPVDGSLAPLFNPRRDEWARHFEVRGALVVGLTSTGRATVDVLAMNARHRLEVRAELVAMGAFP